MVLRVVKALVVGIPVALLLGYYAVPHEAAMSGGIVIAAEPPSAGPGGVARPGGHGAAGDVDPESRPGPQHERLMRLAGRYTCVSRAMMPGEAKAIESRGEAVFTATLGGRFLAQEEAGQMMGLPFEASKLWGYNAQTAQFESVWAYTGSTAMMVLRGKAGEDGSGAIVMTGEAEGHKDGPFRVVIEELDAERFRVRLTGVEAGEDGAGLETVYTRRK